MQATRVVVRTGPAEIECLCRGQGDTVLLLPGLGGDTSQFDALAPALALAGYRAVAINPRGTGGSRGPLENLTLHDFAADAAGVLRAMSPSPAHVIGRAFGNRVARCLAADHADLVRSLVLVSAGGYASAVPGVHTAGGNDRGRGPAAPELSPAAAAQRAATQATPISEWWNGGRAPMLVLQGLEDRVAPPENGRRLRAELGPRVRLIEIAGAGHGLLRDCPEAVAAHVLDFLGAQP